MKNDSNPLGASLCREDMLTYTGAETETSTPAQDCLRSVVVLGSPRRECAGSGICMITTARAVNERWHCPYVSAAISKNAPDTLSFRFLKLPVRLSSVESHFSTGFFAISDAYHLPLHLLRRMNLRPGTCIATGIYPVVETDDAWEVVFPVIAPNGIA